jgi:hypothetical protein
MLILYYRQIIVIIIKNDFRLSEYDDDTFIENSIRNSLDSNQNIDYDPYIAFNNSLSHKLSIKILIQEMYSSLNINIININFDNEYEQLLLDDDYYHSTINHDIKNIYNRLDEHDDSIYQVESNIKNNNKIFIFASIIN